MKKVRFCPKCGSKDIERDLSVKSFAQGSFFNKFKCNKCGYESIFFPECFEEDYKEVIKKFK